MHEPEPGVHPWRIEGAKGEVVSGVAHVPAGEPIGCVVLCHGFKGYKEYGFFPRICDLLEGEGLIAHRFNFSHSGMTEILEIFERTDLFEANTWNRQVEDVQAVVEAIADARIPGHGLPLILAGHSRGGTTVLLSVGRGVVRDVSGLITIAAPAECNQLSVDDAETLRSGGSLASPSSRTGQTLHVGAEWLLEQDEDPAAHSISDLAAAITVPALVIHGEDDPTVPAANARTIASRLSGNTELHLIPGANHVLNTPNPLSPDARTPAALESAVDAIAAFLPATRLNRDRWTIDDLSLNRCGFGWHEHRQHS